VGQAVDAGGMISGGSGAQQIQYSVPSDSKFRKFTFATPQRREELLSEVAHCIFNSLPPGFCFYLRCLFEHRARDGTIVNEPLPSVGLLTTTGCIRTKWFKYTCMYVLISIYSI